MNDLHFSCDCKEVTAIAKTIGRRRFNRVICYCRDCRSFAQHLGRDDILDAAGGTYLTQMPPALFEITKGHENLACLRLRSKGMYRWYTTCCNTPIANSIPGLPFVGVFDHNIESNLREIENKIGPVLGAVHRRHATGEVSVTLRKKAEATLILGVLFKLLRWKLSGLTAPNAFHPTKTKALKKPDVLHKK
ncbi:hypothetical protein CS022_03475 [Veronia nyctiphanis]|uniref:CENP-V/GFA domain-containing protein n=1 Tax=Veronia nyctiphanis TaxID=1278244 RepID=A0A4Q0YUX3_9GAMM|nr:DUF6151 family protein [Veronia nyctiphanis]RXJ74635.1 hypothetical protein CS022_03475 [Veronia nyctiphanis]